MTLVRVKYWLNDSVNSYLQQWSLCAFVKSDFKVVEWLWNWKTPLTFCKRYRVLKCDVIKNQICEIMGFASIFWKSNIQEAYLPKTSIVGQIASEILPQLCSDDSIQILLILTWV